jgi:hypothetical protein
MLCRTAELVQEQVATPAGPSKAKGIVIKIIALTAISLGLVFAQDWASPPQKMSGAKVNTLRAFSSTRLTGCAGTFGS